MSNTFTYKPTIGERGLFTFIEGLLINSGIGYTVDAITNINELNLLGFDLVKEYAKNGVTDLETDIANDATMVRLVGTKVNHYIPTRVITSYPSPDNYEYVHRVLGVNLGKVPVGENFDVLRGKIADLVLTEIGISAKVLVAKQGNNNWVSSVDHRARITQREEHTVVSGTIGAENERLKGELNEAKALIALYEELLAQHAPS